MCDWYSIESFPHTDAVAQPPHESGNERNHYVISSVFVANILNAKTYIFFIYFFLFLFLFIFVLNAVFPSLGNISTISFQLFHFAFASCALHLVFPCVRLFGQLGALLWCLSTWKFPWRFFPLLQDYRHYTNCLRSLIRMFRYYFGLDTICELCGLCDIACECGARWGGLVNGISFFLVWVKFLNYAKANVINEW